MNYPDRTGVSHLLGLLAERATEVMRRDPAEFVRSGVGNDSAPYLGPVITDADGMIQWITLDKLLPQSVRDQLFTQAASA